MFLTEFDPQARIKGSRDPLGLQPVWTALGRRVVGNLTTVTRSARNFSVLLLGLHVADEVVSRRGWGEDRRVEAFLRFEQLAAYSRVAHRQEVDDDGVLGITRVKRRLGEGARVRLGTRGASTILSDQKTYGLWGLYRTAATDSGLCRDERPSGKGQDLVAGLVARLDSAGGGRGGRRVLNLVTSDGVFDPRSDVAAAVARVLGPTIVADERRLLRRTLVDGEDLVDVETRDRQRALARLLDERREGGAGDEVGRSLLLDLERRARRRGEDSLAAELAAILAVEPVLVAARALFSSLLTRDTAQLEALAGDLAKTWPRLAHLDPPAVRGMAALSAAEGEGRARLADVAEALHGGDLERAIRLVIEQNEAVMRQRGGAPWVTCEKGKLRVRRREGAVTLPTLGELKQRWDDSYFLDSLESVARPLREASR